MKPRQTAIVSAAVILPVVAVLWVGNAPRTPSEVSSRSAPAPHHERLSPPDRTIPGRPGRMKDFTSFMERVESPGGVKLTAAEMENYLQSRDRDVESLLVVFRMTLDKALIDEALQKSPNDPEVLLCALHISGKPEERLALIESFKRNDPENGLGNCLAARVLMDLGRDQEAVAELSKSAGKSIDEYVIKGCQSAEEAFLSAGYSPLEAKAAALFGATSPALVQIAGAVPKKFDALRQQHELAGNPADAQSLRDAQAQIGQMLQQNGTILNSLVGMAYERNAWQGLDSPDALAHLQEMKQRKETMLERLEQVKQLRANPQVPDSDWLLYMDRAKIFGEHAANDWILQRHPGH